MRAGPGARRDAEARRAAAELFWRGKASSWRLRCSRFRATPRDNVSSFTACPVMRRCRSWTGSRPDAYDGGMDWQDAMKAFGIMSM